MGKTILVVTHGGVIANTITNLFKADDENFKNFLPPNTGISIIELDFKNGHKMHTLNCIKHLL
jgi:broad specificity phosphatase PhoE